MERTQFVGYLNKGSSPVESWTPHQKKLLTGLPLGLLNPGEVERWKKAHEQITEGVRLGLDTLGFSLEKIDVGFAEPRRRFFNDKQAYYRISFRGDTIQGLSPIHFSYYPGNNDKTQYLADDSYRTMLYVPKRADPVMKLERALTYLENPAAIHKARVFISHRGSFSSEDIANFIQLLVVGRALESRGNPK